MHHSFLVYNVSLISCNVNLSIINFIVIYATQHTRNCFEAHFLGLPRWAGAKRRNLLDFNGAREDNRGRHTDYLAGRHSICTNDGLDPPPSSPTFMPDALPVATPPSLYPGLGQAPNMLACIPSVSYWIIVNYHEQIFTIPCDCFQNAVVVTDTAVLLPRV